MAVNRYMKPAEQPLLDTYVPLPFKEMSMAYATKQKEHNEAEELAGSLDDDILKVRASTPLHVRELGNIRTNLDNDLSNLVDKHGGRYADMVPELNKMKKNLDQDFQNGNLYAIKTTTKRKGKLDKDIQKEETKGTYSQEYSPYLGGEGRFNTFYGQGIESDGQGSYKYSEDSDEGWSLRPDGSRVLKTYEYTGLHKGAEQLKIANTQTFDKIKADLTKWQQETRKGEMTSNELKQISLSKVYTAALNDQAYYPDDFQQELDLIVGSWMTNESVIDSAKNAINNVFGVEPKDAATKEAKQIALDSLGDVDNLGKGASRWAKAAYVGAMGEKYLMTDQAYSNTFNDSYGKKDKGHTPRTDWVPIVESDTPYVQAGKPYMVNPDDGYIADSDNPIGSYTEVIDQNRKDLFTLQGEYNGIKASGAVMDDEYEAEWREKINTAEYQYESSAFAAVNLIQGGAKNLNARRTSKGVQYNDKNGVTQVVNYSDPEFASGGWGSIQFDESGVPLDVEDTNPGALRTRNKTNYLDISRGLISGYRNATKDSDLFNSANSIAKGTGKDGYFGGRAVNLPIFSTTTSKQMDKSILTNLSTTLSGEDQTFTTSNGTTTTLSQLIEGQKIGDDKKTISQEVLDGLDDYVQQVQWTALPNPSTGNFQGVLTLPLDHQGRQGSENATLNLYFDAPKEVRDTWRRQGEYEEVLDEDLGTTHMVTRARTAVEKAKWDDTFYAQLDIQRAVSTAGDVAMSSFEDGEGNALGHYYFAQAPNGQPIISEQYMFQPRPGLLSGINPQDGTPIFTTGDELYNVDSKLDRLGYLIALNDPSMSGSRAFWMAQAEGPETPVAIEGSILTEPSTGHGTDALGKPFMTQLNTGQMMLPDNRLTELTPGSQGNLTNKFIGIQKGVATMFQGAAYTYDENWRNEINTVITGIKDNLGVELADGGSLTLGEAVQAGYITLAPISGGDNGDRTGLSNNGFRLPISNSQRSYQTQLEMYTTWIDGGKEGPPVANPAQGGFHVLGQAVDLDHSEHMYDWMFTVTDEVSKIGGSNTRDNTTYNGKDITATNQKGVLLSNLLKDDGSKVYKNFKKDSMTALFNSMKNTKGGGDGVSLKQFDKEWWHWSYGELTNNPADFVYPSWAN